MKIKKLLAAAAAVTVLLSSMPAIFIDGSAATQISVIYDFENMTEDDLKEAVLSAPAGAFADTEAFITTSVYNSSGNGDSFVGAGVKALKISSDKGSDWPPVGFTLALDGSRLKNASSLVIYLAADDSAGMYFHFVLSDGSIYTVANTGGSWEGNMSKWNGSSWSVFDCGSGGNSFQYCTPGMPGWIKIPFTAEKMVKISGNADSFDKNEIIGLFIAGQSGCLSETNSLYIDEIYAVNSDDGTINFEEENSASPAPVMSPSFEGYTAKTLYDFEELTDETAENLIEITVPQGLDDYISAGASITSSVYNSQGPDDRYIGAGTKALKVSADRGSWPPAGFSLSLSGEDLKNAEAIAFHLGLDTSSESQNLVMRFFYVMSDGSVYTVADGINGEGDSWDNNIAKYDGTKWNTFSCGNENNAYLSYPATTSDWIKIPLAPDKMVKLCGNADAFAVENISGLFIAGNSDVLSAANSIYIDEIYTLTEKTEPVESVRAPSFEGYIREVIYDFEDPTGENIQDIIVDDLPRNLSGSYINKEDSELYFSVYTSKGTDDKYIGAGTKALKVSAGQGSWPPAGFAIKIDGNRLAEGEAVLMHLGLDSSSETKDIVMRFIYVMSDGSVYTVADGINGDVNTWDGNISKYDGSKWSSVACGNQANTYLCYPDTNSAWIKIPLDPDKMVRLGGNSEKFEAKDVTALLIAGNSSALNEQNSIYIDELSLLRTDAIPNTADNTEIGSILMVTLCSGIIFIIISRRKSDIL